jgi:hypothetical protein
MDSVTTLMASRNTAGRDHEAANAATTASHSHAQAAAAAAAAAATLTSEGDIEGELPYPPLQLNYHGKVMCEVVVFIT